MLEYEVTLLKKEYSFVNELLMKQKKEPESALFFNI